MPLTVRHSRDAKYYVYEGENCSRTGEVASVFFRRYLPEAPLVLTLWTDTSGALAIHDPKMRPLAAMRVTLGHTPDLNALTNTIPQLTVGYGNDFTCMAFGVATVVTARGETIWIPIGSLYAAKMASAIAQSFGQTVVEGDVPSSAESPAGGVGQTFVVNVKRVELFEQPLNHINLHLELGLTWKPASGGEAREFTSTRDVRAASLGSILNTSSTLLDNPSRIVDAELNGAVEELIQKTCNASELNESK